MASYSTRMSDGWDYCGCARTFWPGSLTSATCNRLFLIAARLKRLRLTAQLYVGKRPNSKGIGRPIRRFVVSEDDSRRSRGIATPIILAKTAPPRGHGKSRVRNRNGGH